MERKHETRAALDYLTARNYSARTSAEYFADLSEYAAEHGDEALEALAGFCVFVTECIPPGMQHALTLAGIREALTHGPEAIHAVTSAGPVDFVAFWRSTLDEQEIAGFCFTGHTMN